MPYLLKITSGSGEQSRVSLPAEGAVVLGRGSTSDHRIADDEISRKHCRIDCGPGGLTVSDLGSYNGTFVNGEEIGENRALKPGDRIEIGTSVLTVGEPGHALLHRDGEGAVHREEGARNPPEGRGRETTQAQGHPRGIPRRPI
jgi:pSer/pThr/pTyr-binding forkhead associated (FHA) protein